MLMLFICFKCLSIVFLSFFGYIDGKNGQIGPNKITDDRIIEAKAREKFEIWTEIGIVEIQFKLSTGGRRIVGGSMLKCLQNFAQRDGGSGGKWGIDRDEKLLYWPSSKEILFRMAFDDGVIIAREY